VMYSQFTDIHLGELQPRSSPVMTTFNFKWLFIEHALLWTW